MSKREDKKKKKKRQQSELETMIMALVQKSLKAAVDQAMKDVLGGFK